MHKLINKFTRIEVKSIFNGDPATLISALTVVSLVISLRKRSKNMGKQTCNSFCNTSPKLQIICPIQEIERSFTSWSISDVFKRAYVQLYNGTAYTAKLNSSLLSGETK